MKNNYFYLGLLQITKFKFSQILLKRLLANKKIPNTFEMTICKSSYSLFKIQTGSISNKLVVVINFCTYRGDSKAALLLHAQEPTLLKRTKVVFSSVS